MSLGFIFTSLGITYVPWKWHLGSLCLTETVQTGLRNWRMCEGHREGRSPMGRTCLPTHQQQKATIASLTVHASLMECAKDTLLSDYSRHQL